MVRQAVPKDSTSGGKKKPAMLSPDVKKTAFSVSSSEKLASVLNDPHLLKAKAEQLFKGADTDKSGTLNDDEVVALIKKIAEHGHFTMPPEDKIRELLRKSDRSHDGALQLNEFTMFFKNVVGSALKRRQTEEALLAQQEPEPEAEPEPEPEAAAEVKKSLSPGYSLLAHAVQKEPPAAPEPAAPAAVPAIAVPEGHALEPALEESRSSESPYANVAIDGTVTDEPAYTATGPPEGEAAADRLAARATTERGINDVLGVIIAASALYASAVLVARMAKV